MSANVAKLEQMPSLVSRWTHSFEHKGRSYSLFKREDSESAPYYVRVQRFKKRHKHCLETNNQKVAKSNARIYIDTLIAGKYDEVERLKVRHHTSKLSEIIVVYARIHGIGERVAKNNILAIKKILEVVHGQPPDPAQVSLNDIDDSLALSYQDKSIAAYCARAPKDDEGAQREARERALRSSRSTICQARGLFVRKRDHDLIKRYEDAGLNIPPSVERFMKLKLRGKMSKAHYSAPADKVVEKAFVDIEELRDSDSNVYKAFWSAVGAGLRKQEIGRLTWEMMIERDGFTWIKGGIGKDGKTIEVPMQARAVEALASFRKDAGGKGPVIVGEKIDQVAKRLNWWMKFKGWQTEKKMHELRAYVGSLIYRKNPQAAMSFLRHKSIRTTEEFYIRYGPASKPIEVL